MSESSDLQILSVLRHSVVALGLTLTLFGCSTPSGKAPDPVETRDETGFSIRESVRIGMGVRSDFEKASLLLEREEYDRGIELLTEVTEAAPDLATAHINLGIAYGRIGDLERSEVSLRRALEANPRHPVAHNELGIVYRRTGRFEEARQSYEAALASYPEFHFARRNLAILCDLYLADSTCALEQYALYLESVPDDDEVVMWIADLQNRSGR